jgi:hypothetical protein
MLLCTRGRWLRTVTIPAPAGIDYLLLGDIPVELPAPISWVMSSLLKFVYRREALNLAVSCCQLHFPGQSDAVIDSDASAGKPRDGSVFLCRLVGGQTWSDNQTGRS